MKISFDGKNLEKVTNSDLNQKGEFDFPQGVNIIKKNAINCSQLKSLTVPEPVIEIGDGGFSGCTSLMSLTLPKSLKKIGIWAFNNCSRLGTIVLPDDVIEIETSTFQNCCSLTSVVLPGKLKRIGENAFTNCTSLHSIFVPKTVNSIGNDAFYGCKMLTEVVISHGVKKIGKGVFTGCENLQSLVIPQSITQIGELTSTAGSELKNLKNIIIHAGNEKEFSRIEALLLKAAQKFPEKLPIVPWKTLVQAKKLQKEVLEKFCNLSANQSPLSGHKILSGDVIGGISSFRQEALGYHELQQSLALLIIPFSGDLQSYKLQLDALLEKQLRRNQLYPLQRYQDLMRQQAPSNVFANPCSANSRNYPLWVRYVAIEKILRGYPEGKLPELSKTEREALSLSSTLIKRLPQEVIKLLQQNNLTFFDVEKQNKNDNLELLVQPKFQN